MVIEKSQEIQGYRTKDMNMEKYKFDENNGLWYELQGDYYLPCLKLPEEERPQLVMIYFEDSDTYGHTYSPHSKETRRCVEELDALMKYLWEGLQSLPFGKDINLIVTSDHGMATVSADRFVPIVERKMVYFD